jgi:hypothetical protein
VIRKYILIKTIPKKEKTITRDLCDCIYYFDEGARCEAIATGVIYVYTYINYFEACNSMKYFKVLIRKFEVFDHVDNKEPSCVGCHVVKVGSLYFIRMG